MRRADRKARTATSNVRDKLTFLRASEKLHYEFLHRLHRAGLGYVWGVDLVVWGVLRRSLLLIDGFVPLVRKGNEVAAVPLIRLQIDNALRLFACSQGSHPDEVLRALLEGKPLGRMKARDGERMTDAYLVRRFSVDFPWVAKVYEKTSGFIHLSSPGLLQTVEKSDDRVVTFSVESRPEGKWRSDSRLEAVEAFIAATDSLLHVVGSWLKSKEVLATNWHATASQSQGAG